jgi:tRNA G46 methylase TrmB
MGRWSRLVAGAFPDWIDAPENLRWLDVGCGKGAFTKELGEFSPQTVSLKVSPSWERSTWLSSVWSGV